MILDNGALRVEVVPYVGAKVTSLIDLLSGREWIAVGSPTTRAPGLDADPAEHMGSGWYECFPSISGGFHPGLDWRAIRLADHGEIWSRPWSATAVRSDAIVTSIEGARFPYRFERRLTLDGRSLHADYAVTSQSPIPLPCMWAMHMLINASPGMRLLMPTGTPVTIDFLQPPGTRPSQSRASWPWLAVEGRVRDLSQLRPISEGFATKIFANNLGVWGARLLDPQTQTLLEVGLVDSVTPFLGIWLNEGGWPSQASGLYQLGLEPATGSSDDLETALANRSTVVSDEEPLTWRITLTIKDAHGVKEQPDWPPDPNTHTSSPARGGGNVDC